LKNEEHLVRIPAKAANVVLHPLQSQALILEAQVSGNDVIAEAQKSEDAEPIIESNLKIEKIRKLPIFCLYEKKKTFRRFTEVFLMYKRYFYVISIFLAIHV
jgi:hypothetical protein